jgi:hypothetical protein
VILEFVPKGQYTLADRLAEQKVAELQGRVDVSVVKPSTRW